MKKYLIIAFIGVLSILGTSKSYSDLINNQLTIDVSKCNDIEIGKVMSEFYLKNGIIDMFYDESNQTIGIMFDEYYYDSKDILKKLEKLGFRINSKKNNSYNTSEMILELKNNSSDLYGAISNYLSNDKAVIDYIYHDGNLKIMFLSNFQNPGDLMNSISKLGLDKNRVINGYLEASTDGSDKTRN